MVVLELGFRLRTRVRVRIGARVTAFCVAYLCCASCLSCVCLGGINWLIMKSNYSFETSHACHILAVWTAWCETWILDSLDWTIDWLFGLSFGPMWGL